MNKNLHTLKFLFTNLDYSKNLKLSAIGGVLRPPSCIVLVMVAISCNYTCTRGLHEMADFAMDPSWQNHVVPANSRNNPIVVKREV
jgi:hypothetical protein